MGRHLNCDNQNHFEKGQNDGEKHSSRFPGTQSSRNGEGSVVVPGLRHNRLTAPKREPGNRLLACASLIVFQEDESHSRGEGQSF